MLGRILLGAAVLSTGLFAGSVVEIAAQGRGEWVRCADEGGFCRVPFPTVVRYGARGSFAEMEVDRGVPCSNRVFGDPADGVRKSCWFQDRRGGGGWDRSRPPREPEWGGGGGWDRPREPQWAVAAAAGGGGGGGWVNCAREGGYCRTGGRAEVRFGIGGSWITYEVRGGIRCTNDAFGGDPAHGVPKICQVRQ